MSTSIKHTVSIFALSTLLLVSFVSVCRQMLTTCGWDCSPAGMSVMHMDTQTDGCALNAWTCSTPIQEHMTTFASMYPSLATDVLLFLFVLAGSAFFIVSGWRFKDEPGDHARLRAKLRSLRQRLSNSIAPNFLVFAFSQGIINSRLYV